MIRQVLQPVHGILPSSFKRKVFDELWQKSRIDTKVRDIDKALVLKTHPLPYLELYFEVTNHLPSILQVYGASIEIWLGKPVAQFYTFMSESIHPGERRETFRATHFLNAQQADLLKPDKKTSAPPPTTIVLTVCCRSSFGMVEKTVKTTWKPVKVVP